MEHSMAQSRAIGQLLAANMDFIFIVSDKSYAEIGIRNTDTSNYSIALDCDGPNGLNTINKV